MTLIIIKLFHFIQTIHQLHKWCVLFIVYLILMVYSLSTQKIYFLSGTMCYCLSHRCANIRHIPMRGFIPNNICQTSYGRTTYIHTKYTYAQYYLFPTTNRPYISQYDPHHLEACSQHEQLQTLIKLLFTISSSKWHSKYGHNHDINHMSQIYASTTHPFLSYSTTLSVEF